MLNYKNELRKILFYMLLVSFSSVTMATESKVRHVVTKKGVECVIVKAYRTHDVGISCNWQKQYADKANLC